jgi:5,10-methenyltetrahydrofolate synthetase
MSYPTYSSPPCFAHEIDEGWNGFEPVDPQTAIDVARWRKSERERLIAARLAVSIDERSATARNVIDVLDGLTTAFSRPVVGLYWPFRGELDLREWMVALCKRGARVALPAVVAKGQPLQFREWRPGCRMERGVWNIPVPADDRGLTPEIVISPVVGADRAGYRLGYGGGFYDRTLAAIPDRPLTIGVGHPVAEIGTIFPQPHDIPLDWMILGEKRWERPG